MQHRVRLFLALVFLWSGILAAQEPDERVQAAAMREAERFVNCLLSNDLPCAEEMMPRERLAAAGLSRLLDGPRNFMNLRATMLSVADYHRLEVGQPWSPMAIGDALFIFVPVLQTIGRQEEDVVRENEAQYFLGVSEDAGESWRFIVVNYNSSLTVDELDRFMPGFVDWPTPETLEFGIRERPLSRSHWLATTKREFVAVDKAFRYSLEFEIHEGLELPLDFTVSYVNPADMRQASKFHGSLEPGQRVVRWQSPALSGFGVGSAYVVTFEGSDPDTGNPIFVHAEELVFELTRDLWLSALSKPPAPDPALAALPPTERMRESVTRASARYARCWATVNTLCVDQMTARDHLAAAGLLTEEIEHLGNASLARRTFGSAFAVTDHWMEAASPWPPFAIGDKYFAFIPYFESSLAARTNVRTHLMSYLAGVSADGGESWLFAMTNVDRVVPDYGDGPRPEIREIEFEEPRPELSRWVSTTERSLVAVDGGYAYAMGFELEPGLDGPVDIAVRYDDPADANQPLHDSTSLGIGQSSLRWQSRVLTGFEAGKTYEVVIVGREAGNGSRLFVHRDQLVFQPTFELWKSVLSKHPDERAVSP